MEKITAKYTAKYAIAKISIKDSGETSVYYVVKAPRIDLVCNVNSTLVKLFDSAPEALSYADTAVPHDTPFSIVPVYASVTYILFRVREDGIANVIGVPSGEEYYNWVEYGSLATEYFHTEDGAEVVRSYFNDEGIDGITIQKVTKYYMCGGDRAV